MDSRTCAKHSCPNANVLLASNRSFFMAHRSRKTMPDTQTERTDRQNTHTHTRRKLPTTHTRRRRRHTHRNARSRCDVICAHNFGAHSTHHTQKPCTHLALHNPARARTSRRVSSVLQRNETRMKNKKHTINNTFCEYRRGSTNPSSVRAHLPKIAHSTQRITSIKGIQS